MKYYHITKRKHLESITSKGILPGHRKGLTTSKERLKEVYVTDDPNRILLAHAGPNFISKNDLVVLTLDLSDVEVKPVQYRCGMTYTISDFEYVTNKIDFKRIVNIEEVDKYL